jgi:hypothetical protein
VGLPRYQRQSKSFRRRPFEEVDTPLEEAFHAGREVAYSFLRGQTNMAFSAYQMVESLSSHQ